MLKDNSCSIRFTPLGRRPLGSKADAPRVILPILHSINRDSLHQGRNLELAKYVEGNVARLTPFVMARVDRGN